MLTEVENKLHKIRVDHRLAQVRQERELEESKMLQFEEDLPAVITAFLKDLEAEVVKNPEKSVYNIWLADPFPGSRKPQEAILLEKFETALREIISDFSIEMEWAYNHDHGDEILHYNISWYPPSSVTPVNTKQE